MSRETHQLTQQLPAFNRAVQSGRLSLSRFLDLGRAALLELSEEPADPSPERQRLAMVETGMLLLSLERHGRMQGWAPGFTFDLVPGLERAQQSRVPADEAPTPVFTDYLETAGFVGTQAEDLFLTSGQAISAQYAAVLELIAPLSDPDQWLNASSGTRVQTATAHLNVCVGLHQSQAHASAAVRQEFRDVVRTYFLELRIGGRLWSGLNAAHAPAVAAMDLALGVDDAGYRTYLLEVEPNLRATGRRIVRGAQHGGGLAGALCRLFRVRSLDDPRLPDLVRAAEPTLRTNFTMFVGLLDAHAAVGGRHNAVIARVLEAPDLDPQAPALAATVAAAVGSGGNRHAETRDFVRMRRKAAAAARMAAPWAPRRVAL